jgi:alkylhydroperoxidase family enzyme
MPRIPALTRESLPPDKRPIYDASGQSRGQVSDPFPVLLNSPEVASRIAALGHDLRYESTLQPMIRELAIMTVAHEFDCQYTWTSHEPLVRQAGVRDEAIRRVLFRCDPRDGLLPSRPLRCGPRRCLQQVSQPPRTAGFVPVHREYPPDPSENHAGPF